MSAKAKHSTDHITKEPMTNLWLLRLCEDLGCDVSTQKYKSLSFQAQIVGRGGCAITLDEMV